MEDLLTALVAAVEIILLGSETLLEWLSDTDILGASLYAWFLGYLVLDTILSLFVQVRYDELDSSDDDSFNELENKLNDPYFLENDKAFNEFYNELSDPQLKAIALNKRKQVLKIIKDASLDAEEVLENYKESVGENDDFNEGYGA